MSLLEKSDLKTYLGLTDSETQFDSQLTSIAAAVQSIFDELVGRTTESDEFTEYYDSPSRTQKVFLKNFPVTVDSVSVYDDPDWVWAAASQLAAADFRVNLVTGIIHYDGFFFEGFQSIKVVYTAGYASDTFPAGWKEIWTRQGCLWYKDVKNEDWGLGNIVHGSGGSVFKKDLIDNLLPDFALLVEQQGGNIASA